MPQDDASRDRPIPAERVPSGAYSPEFLHGLTVRRKVAQVGEDWGGDLSTLPARVSWILYPNGDLQRVSFD